MVWVDELMVAEHMRRSGVGSALMRHVEAWAHAAGAAQVALATRRAGAFYGSLGYFASAEYFKKPLA